MKEMVGGCCVCSDERGWDENPLVYCDGQGCTVAVHQACYGIVTVPSGPWYCRKCESQERSARVRCELCPSKEGALKRTDSNGWAHVVCALYIPEVRFGNVTSMEPILISLIPPERFGKHCYICDEGNKGSKASTGACMQCNKPGCKQNFHVTCAQMLGLLCEEAGNMHDNVKYCGYCQYHYSKLKKSSHVKIIPPFRPISNSAGANQSQQSSPEATAGMNLNKDVSPEISKGGPLKKKLSSSSSTSSSSSKGSASGQHTSSAIPRIAPSNLFSASSFSASIIKSGSDRPTDLSTMSATEGTNLSTKSPIKDDSFVLKSDDLKSHNPSYGSGGDPKKFIKAGDIMTVKLNDVLSASLDRPIVDHPPSTREKVSPPDIKPHVTLTPIPMRSSDKAADSKTDVVLFGQSAPNPPMSKVKEPSADKDKTLAEISSVSSTSKRSRGMDYESPPKIEAPSHSTGSDSTRSSKEKTPATVDNGKSTATSRDESRKTPSATPSPMSIDESKTSTEVTPVAQSQPPVKRGPGRPVKRRSSGPSRDEEPVRVEDPQKKKAKRGGRRGGGGGTNYSNRRDESNDRASIYMEEDSNDNKRRKPPQTPKKIDDGTPTLSQLKAQMDAKKAAEAVPSTVLPAHMFGNALNPASSMAQRMVDTLSQEMETMAEAGIGFGEKLEKPVDKLVGIPLPKFAPSVSSGLTNGSSPLPLLNGVASQIANGSATNGSGGRPQTLEQLLERQWEQGSQFLMEQAQHLDIAQLLSCLNQLKQDNRALEEHINSLLQRKDQLTAINARLSVPLGTTLAIGNGPSSISSSNQERTHEGLQLHPARPNHIPNDIGAHHPHQSPHPMSQQPVIGNRPVNFNGNGLPVPVVVSSHSHPPPHVNQGHGPR